MNIDMDFLKNSANPYRHAIMISAAALLATMTLVFIGILPSRNKLSAGRTKTAEQKKVLESMRADIQGTEPQRKKNESARKEHRDFVASGVIEPLLGSFAMRGKNLLDPFAQKTGFVIDTVKDLPPLPIRLPHPPPEQLYARRPIEFTGHGTYTQIVAFVSAVEASLPLVTLHSIKILGQPQTPETHKSIISFEWPAKGEMRQPDIKAKGNNPAEPQNEK